MGEEPLTESWLVIYTVEREPSPRGVDRRNIAIIGAPDVGATTLTERMVTTVWRPIGPCRCCGMDLGTEAHMASTCAKCQTEERSANRRAQR